MKRQSRQSTCTRSPSVNHYNAREMAKRLSESVCKGAEDAHEEDIRKKIEEDVVARLTTHFNKQWAKKEAILKHELATEKASWKRDMKKNQFKLDKIQNFIKGQQAGSSTTPADFSTSEDQADEDKDDTTKLDDDSHV